jgi:hypothetical protein
MDEWQIFLTIAEIVGFVSVIVGFVLKITKVVDANTFAINRLTDELLQERESNEKDHEQFYKSINTLKQDVSNLKIKHDADVQILEEHIRN